MKKILLDIKSLQSEADGLFPSLRSHAILGLQRKDNNIFFTALIVFTLDKLKKHLSADEAKIVDGIKANALKAFPLYKNKKGERVYNFWQTEPHQHFPDGIIFSRFNYFRLPDDADDTALIYLAEGYSTDDIVFLKNKLVRHANLASMQAQNTLPHYKNLKLYSSWFGKKMPIEIDVCVISNILYLFFESNSLLNEYDNDCIRFIISVIEKDEHKTNAFRVSPNYANTSIILYHISRLLTITNQPELLMLKEKLIADIREIISNKRHLVELIILNTALLWLGEKEGVMELEMPVDIEFPWFRAGMMSTWENPVSRLLAPLGIFHFSFYSEACVSVLFLEYTLLKNGI